MNQRGSDATRALLIRTAVRMFAEHGVEDVSLRDIGTEAGQANKTVVHYYFGSREGLLAAVAQEYGSGNETGVELPDDRPVTPQDIAELIVGRLASYLDREPAYLVLAARLMGERGPYNDIIAREPGSKWVDEVNERVWSDLGLDALLRMTFAWTLAVHAVADMGRRVIRGAAVADEAETLPRLVRAVAAILSDVGGEP